MKTAMISSNESNLPDGIASQIRNAGIELICKKCSNAEELAAFAGDADVLWMYGANLAVTPEVLDRLPKCRALFRSGSGVDALPLKRAAELGIRVCNTPESIAESVAEHAVALLFSLIRLIPRLDREVRSGIWRSAANEMQWHICGRTLGLVGYGRIARDVERMVSGFRMKVLFHDPFCPGSTELDTLLRESDYISLHCPLTDQTYHRIGAREFGLMKPNALLVNTSRGPVMDEKALVEALKSGRIGGAALDVTDPEPPEKENPLFALENVIVTPHIAAFSADFQKNFWQCSVNKLKELKEMLG